MIAFVFTAILIKNHILTIGNKHGQVYGKSAPVYHNLKFVGHMSKISIKVLFKLEFFHDTLYCCVRYSNIEDLRIPYNKDKSTCLETKKLSVD